MERGGSGRAKRYQKREGDARKISLDDALPVGGDPGRDLVALDDALTALATVDANKKSGRAAVLRRSYSSRARRAAGVEPVVALRQE